MVAPLNDMIQYEVIKCQYKDTSLERNDWILLIKDRVTLLAKDLT